MRTLIKNGYVIDPANSIEETYDLLVEDKIIIKIASKIDEPADRIIDATGYWVVPGLIDMHVHFREPGQEHKETIKTGALSAAKGGYTTVCTMPNTDPVIDNEYLVEYVKMKAEKEAVVHLLPIGAITKGQKGEELANIGNMAKAGVCGISEDGKSVMNTALYKKAMTYAKMFDLIIFAHCEDKDLAGSGVMNAGEKALSLGLAGIGNDVEDVIVARDIILADKTKVKLHICHVSTEGAVRLIQQAKLEGIDVTGEICPHHFTLSDEAIEGFDTNYKMNPPLRSKKDVQALKEALKNNTINIIATDHAPHHFDDKNGTFQEAAFGIVGLETAVPLTITELVEQGFLTPSQMVEKMSLNPARRLGIDKGTLGAGKMADITLIDPTKTYLIDKKKFLSKGKNTPFHGREVRGKVMLTMVAGQVVYEASQEI